jgi:nucleoid-associated protein YgaU
MTPLRTLLAASAAIALASCANQQGGAENYDTPTTPYDAYGDYSQADSGYADATPYQAFDPVYDTPPAYEETRVRPPFDDAPRPATRPAQPAPAGPASVHTVVLGDTLWGLSRQYGVSIDAIKQANAMTNDTVVLGQRLQIPAR